MSSLRIRDHSPLAELVDAAEKHCVMYVAQRIVVDNCLSTEEEAADLLYSALKRIRSVRRLVEQKAAF